MARSPLQRRIFHLLPTLANRIVLFILPASGVLDLVFLQTCFSIHSYVFAMPRWSFCVGFHPSLALIRLLSERRPRTPIGPGTWAMDKCFPDMPITIFANRSIVTISSEPILTGPIKDERIRRTTPSRHSSIYRNDL